MSMCKNIVIFKNGLVTGLLLQLAVGPVFFFIINLTLQKTIFDGLIAVMAVTIVDYFYITLSIIGVSTLLEKKKIKKWFGIVSSGILVIFGFILINNIFGEGLSSSASVGSANFVSSFTSVFFLTIFSPMTIVFFTSLFTSKSLEYNYTKRELIVFGFSTGLATFIFMGVSVILFSFIKEAIPLLLIQILNLVVGVFLIGYGGVRLIKILKDY